jgi:isopentenyl-diphosphate delta-isomerase
LTDWGIPTAISLLEARGAGLPLIATGGVRSGVDMAKAIALGATAVGIGRPALLAAQQGYEALLAELHAYVTELRTVMTLTGCADIAALRQHRPVVTGTVWRWAEQRGLKW